MCYPLYHEEGRYFNLNVDANASKHAFIGWESPEKFQKKHGNASLDFIIVLNRKTVDLEIKGPTADKELVDYAIWLPNKKINSSSNSRLSYISYIEEGMKKVLSLYGFEIEPFDLIFSKLKEKEIEKS